MNNQELYLDYVNNFLTVERFAEYYNMPIDKAEQVISEGREEHEKKVKEFKALKDKP